MAPWCMLSSPWYSTAHWRSLPELGKEKNGIVIGQTDQLLRFAVLSPVPHPCLSPLHLILTMPISLSLSLFPLFPFTCRVHRLSYTSRPSFVIYDIHRPIFHTYRAFPSFFSRPERVFRCLCPHSLYTILSCNAMLYNACISVARKHVTKIVVFLYILIFPHCMFVECLAFIAVTGWKKTKASLHKLQAPYPLYFGLFPHTLV